MLAALIIVFREVFEAGLIIGIVLTVTRSVRHRNRWIGGGVLGGAAAACVVAAFTGALSRIFAGMGQELFNAAAKQHFTKWKIYRPLWKESCYL